MKSGLLLSIISIALLGLLGWVKQDRARSHEARADIVMEGEDFSLFIG